MRFANDRLLKTFDECYSFFKARFYKLSVKSCVDFSIATEKRDNNKESRIVTLHIVTQRCEVFNLKILLWIKNLLAFLKICDMMYMELSP